MSVLIYVVLSAMSFSVFHIVRFIKFSDHALQSGECRTGTEHSII